MLLTCDRQGRSPVIRYENARRPKTFQLKRPILTWDSPLLVTEKRPPKSAHSARGSISANASWRPLRKWTAWTELVQVTPAEFPTNALPALRGGKHQPRKVPRTNTGRELDSLGGAVLQRTLARPAGEPLVTDEGWIPHGCGESALCVGCPLEEICGPDLGVHPARGLNGGHRVYIHSDGIFQTRQEPAIPARGVKNRAARIASRRP